MPLHVRVRSRVRASAASCTYTLAFDWPAGSSPPSPLLATWAPVSMRSPFHPIQCLRCLFVRVLVIYSWSGLVRPGPIRAPRMIGFGFSFSLFILPLPNSSAIKFGRSHNSPLLALPALTILSSPFFPFFLVFLFLGYTKIHNNTRFKMDAAIHDAHISFFYTRVPLLSKIGTIRSCRSPGFPKIQSSPAPDLPPDC